MASFFDSPISVIGVIVLALVVFYLIDPTFFGLLRPRYEGWEDATMSSDSLDKQKKPKDVDGAAQETAVESNPNSEGGDASMSAGAAGSEGFANVEDISGPAQFASASAPSGCYPRDQLTPSELLPRDTNSVWAQQNPMGTGSLKGKNFLSAGSLIGINTVGQSLRNANYQLRSEPANPQIPVSVFNNSTIEPDTNRRDFEVS